MGPRDGCISLQAVVLMLVRMTEVKPELLAVRSLTACRLDSKIRMLSDWLLLRPFSLDGRFLVLFLLIRLPSGCLRPSSSYKDTVTLDWLTPMAVLPQLSLFMT